MSGPPRAWAHLTGRVTSFDEHRGRGEVDADAGDRYGFHCTALADGTRRVDVGTAVAFVVVAGPGGAWEAAEVIKLEG